MWCCQGHFVRVLAMRILVLRLLVRPGAAIHWPFAWQPFRRVWCITKDDGPSGWKKAWMRWDHDMTMTWKNGRYVLSWSCEGGRNMSVPHEKTWAWVSLMKNKLAWASLMEKPWAWVSLMEKAWAWASLMKNKLAWVSLVEITWAWVSLMKKEHVHECAWVSLIKQPFLRSNAIWSLQWYHKKRAHFFRGHTFEHILLKRTYSSKTYLKAENVHKKSGTHF